MNSLLDNLKQYTTVVADTGDFERIKSFQPQDATTNPSLILKAAKQENYSSLIHKIKQAKHADLNTLMDEVLVQFGMEILKLVPGRVSTEVDARLSFDAKETITRAQSIIKRYENYGVNRNRVLIKIASTWEGIQAAAALESEGIHCNMTLLFSLAQAVACADAKVQLISPFVGRITDWHKKFLGNQWNDALHGGINDPGVVSVRSIYNYYKNHDITTEVMGASFRNIHQIIHLAGCDLLTISPELLQELSQTQGSIEPALTINHAKSQTIEILKLSRDNFHTMMHDDAMASEKLNDGIRQFTSDIVALEEILNQ